MLLFFIWFLLKLKLPITTISPNPPDSSLSTTNRLQQCRTRTAGKDNADNADLQMWAAHPPGASAKNPLPPLPPPPTWCLIVDLPSLLIFTFHFPPPGDISIVTEADVLQGLGGAAYMSVDVHLCLHRLKPWQPPNWISAYGKVGGGGGLGLQEETAGGRKLNSCLSLFGILASPGGIKQGELCVSLFFFFGVGGGSPWNIPRAVGGSRWCKCTQVQLRI